MPAQVNFFILKLNIRGYSHLMLNPRLFFFDLRLRTLKQP